MKSFLSSFAMKIPGRLVTNDDLASMIETTDEWISKRTGIKSRYWVEEPETTSNLGAASARETLKRFNKKPEAIIAATLSADYSFPGIGVQIQNELELSNIPAFDLRNQCSGFLYGLELGSSLIKSKQYNSILLIGAEVHSTGLDLTTHGRDIAVLFGDGAGSCMVLSEELIPDTGIIYEILGTQLHSDGAFVKDLWCEHPGSAHFPTRITADLIEDRKCFPFMNGRKVFEHAVKEMASVASSMLKKLEIPLESVNYFVPHQANIRINEMVAKQLGISSECCFNTIDRFGNTTAATIPIGFSCLEKERELKTGDIILSAAFGSGFTWGAAALRVHRT